MYNLRNIVLRWFLVTDILHFLEERLNGLLMQFYHQLNAKSAKDVLMPMKLKVLYQASSFIKVMVVSQVVTEADELWLISIILMTNCGTAGIHF